MTTRKLSVGKWSYENKEKKEDEEKEVNHISIRIRISINDSEVFGLGEGKVDIPEKTLRAQKPKTNGTAKEEIRANMVR